MSDKAHPHSEDTPPVVEVKREFGLIRAHAHAAIVTLVISAIFGLIVSLKLHHPDLAGTEPWLTWGRLRYNHTQGIFFGWLGNAFLMFLYYAVPHLANRPVLSKRLGWFLFVLWNFAVVLPGWMLVLAGISQPLEWGEFPLIVDAFVVLALALSIVQFALPLLRSKLSLLYVSGWYILGALFFTLLAYPVGNVVPQLLPGAEGAAFSGLWIHDAIGLYVTPLAVAIAYYVIPLATRRPIYSHFLSMIGFWLLFFVYPLNGTHHYVFSALPMEAQQGAIAASVYLGVDVILVVSNLLLSLRGAASNLKKDISLRFVWMGTILYLIVSMQGSMQALMPVNRLTHFSDWVIGHSHLAMLGFATFTAIGGMTYVWQRVPGVRFNANALRWCYWLLLMGLIGMVGILTVAGLIEAHMWQTSLPWLDSVRSVRDYWVFRSFVGLPLIAGFIMLWHALTTGDEVVLREAAPDAKLIQPEANSSSGSASGASSTDSSGSGAPPAAAKPARWLSMAYLAAAVAGVGFFIFSFAVLGVFPGYALEKEIARTRPATMAAPTPQEQNGRLVYAREGCAYCHTQQVRVVPADVERFGAPTRAWETTYDYPHLWGTRRIGPDLAREAGLRADDWQLTHLYNPRLVTKDSPMPGYPWLFDGSASVPKQEALDLLAYLKSLGRARQLAGDDRKQWSVPAYCDCSASVKSLESNPTALSASGAARRNSPSTLVVQLPTDANELAGEVRRGGQLFAENCASCHGAQGKGDGPASASLLPHAADLTSCKFSVSHIGCAILNGVPGTAMPAWRELPQKDVEALVAFVSSLNPSAAEAVSTEGVAEGQKLFAQKCASCHGSEGRGNGPAAGALDRCPTNFTQVQPSAVDAMRMMEMGVPGTAMPPWKDQLSEPERRLLTAYLRSLYQSGEQ